MDSASTQVTIINKLGLHARPAMSFVDTASSFTSDIKVTKEEQTADGKSIMQLMMLAAPKGTTLQIDAEGPDADKAIEALTDLVASKFDEV